MVTIDVVWTQEVPADWSSKAIMWGMGKNYSHVAIVGRALDGKEYWCHAIDQGVCYTDPSEYLKNHIIVRKKSVQLTCTREELQGFIMGESGKEYSDSQLVFAGVKDYPVLGWLARHLIRLNGNEKRICSEFVAIVLFHYSEYRYDLAKRNLDLITPAELEEILDPEILVK